VKVQSLIPREHVEVAELIQGIQHAKRLRPFSNQLVELCGYFAAALASDPEARVYPELVALAFWMRKAEIKALERGFAELETQELIRVPRGLVFHIPPANVDVMFVYSWFFSLLCGNRNVVRLSHTRARSTDILIRTLGDVMAQCAPTEIRDGNRFIEYGHEEEINSALSDACDARVIWGGDRTIVAFRRYETPPRAVDLVFADRFSLSLLRAEAVLGLDEAGIDRLAEEFYNDAFWYHQLACSSPRLVLWYGKERQCRAAGDRLFSKLATVVAAKGYVLPPAARMSRFAFECEAAIARPVAGRRDYGNAFTTIRLASLEGFDRHHCGAGLFFEYYTDSLPGLSSFWSSKDQTIDHFGFSATELRDAVMAWNGGIDRMVPIGQALRFSRYWDGMDLLVELTRCINVVI